VVRVLGYRFRGPGSIPGTTRFSGKKQKTKKKKKGKQYGLVGHYQQFGGTRCHLHGKKTDRE
jgi:hypothetical protein